MAFAQGGFSGGFARGAGIALQKKAIEAEKLKQRQDRLKSAIDGSEKATIDGLTAATELITELAKAGATEDAQEAAKQGEMLLAPHATLLDEIRTRAILSAKNPQEKELAESLPSGPDFVQRHIGQFQQALALGESQATKTLSPEEANVLGFPEGAIVQRTSNGDLKIAFDPTENPSNLQERVALLVQSGVDTETAQGIAAGRFVISVNPISNERQVTDIATGKQVGLIPKSKPQGDVPSLIPGDIDTGAATGAGGILRDLTNIISDAIGAGVQFEAAQEATNALESIEILTTITMQQAVPGRPSKFLLEKLGKLTVKPNSLLQGEDRAKSRLTQTRRILDGEIKRMEIDVLPLELQPDVRVETQLNLTELKRLRDAYDELIKGFDDVDMDMDIPEGVSDEDRKLFPFLSEAARAKIIQGIEDNG